MEAYWVDQLLSYLQRLQATPPAQSPEEQFSQSYMMRKWLFWVPVSLLQRQGGKGPAMLTLAHFYATALTLEPLFPDLGASFCSALALPARFQLPQPTDAEPTWRTHAVCTDHIRLHRRHEQLYHHRKPQPCLRALNTTLHSFSINLRLKLKHTLLGSTNLAKQPDWFQLRHQLLGRHAITRFPTTSIHIRSRRRHVRHERPIARRRPRRPRLPRRVRIPATRMDLSCLLQYFSMTIRTLNDSVFQDFRR
jgi:hypothetical protein